MIKSIKSFFKLFKQLVFLFSFCILSSCNGFFEKDNTPPPAPLVPFQAKLHPKLHWGVRTSYHATGDYLRIQPAITKDKIITADRKGTVTAVSKKNGRLLWQTATTLSIAGGPGADNGFIVIGSRKGQIEALHEESGTILWKKKISKEILAQPAVLNNTAVFKTTNGYLYGLSLQNGEILWSRHQEEPALILRVASTPQCQNTYCVIGFASGTLLKISLEDGSTLWQQTIANPQGAFAIQRMIDIDANPILFDNTVYAATYQGAIAALNNNTGNVLWSHNISSYTGLAATKNRIYVTDARSAIWAFNANNGEVLWKQTDLADRQISGPVIMENYLVVGDSQGYLHWLSLEDGNFTARTRINKSSIVATPLVEQGVLYVLSSNGYLAAYTLH